MKQKTIAIAIATALMALSISPAGAAAKYDYNVRVKVNENVIKSDVKPFIDVANSRTYVPIRFVSQALGEKIEWNNKTKTVTVKTAAGKKIELSRGQKVAVVNGVKQSIDAPAMEVSNRVMVPLRFVSEQMGATVTPKKENGWTTVNIAYAKAPGGKGEEKQPEKGNKTFDSFALDPKYNKFAPYLFKNNMRVDNGELVFTVPNLKWASASYEEWGKSTELVPGKEYRYKLGEKGYLIFAYSHDDSTVESYAVYVSPDHKNLKGEFNDVSGDAIVSHNLDAKRTASPLSSVVKQFK
ncbi:copper amine oxidase N-terminal domain-containing protein [Paenibacillus alvei]|uniref:copper amine oxidase N-terminal domain-containing protein n=1 Tax=Paenibacillus alvei TaxID=44250 RepID=UPI000289F83F|nr:copper amine oxidase N-terminal domain-containing protein [Paenibacillus alvei]EJW14378.1 copper amine oxidase N-terminal domain-containing protein [Paenibacillus alvei DSM 29]MCY9539406.1 copper amine oxidase N-terminal domain-containing protein [Paenibacillus alvei]MEC0079836.1 copper amine oxidase N-terminal domain-containing protein [Paenibacillus alvei]